MDLNYFKQIIKIKYKNIKNYLDYVKVKRKNVLDINQHYAFIFFAADYNNLGDLAITLAQENYLKSVLGEKYIIVKVAQSETISWVKEIKRMPTDRVIITLIGGGNNGSLYEFIEEPRRFVLKYLRNNKIISFPQTVVFEDNSKALPYKKEFIRLCSKCQDLTLVAREAMSYESYKKMISSNVLLTPDIVFSMKTTKTSICREGVAFILRNDKEKKIDSREQKLIIDTISPKFNKTYFIDTCDIVYEEDNSVELLSDYLHLLEKVQLAVTDRLHGMILCYITNTPCIVIDNNHNKIKATYDTWIKNVDEMIYFYQNYDERELLKVVDEFSVDHLSKRKDELREYFEPLREVLQR